MLPFFVTIPHSGEQIPPEANWLEGKPETLVMCDVDRYVDRLYEPALQKLEIPFVKTQWHRYVIDLNRLPDDVDRDSVIGHANPSGKFARGLHWVITTLGEKLMPAPITPELHDELVSKYFYPFHAAVETRYSRFFSDGAKRVFHIDAHSMPSVGTSEHKDPGERRKDIVISDCDGKSCSQDFLDLVTASYKQAGFDVGYNWPYKGGRVTETYGHPDKGQEALQVELNRSLYMDEKTKQWSALKATAVQSKIHAALARIQKGLESL